MSSCMPIIKTMTGRNASEAINRTSSMMWQLIDWERATLIVKSLQARIVKAVQAQSWKKIRDLQRLLNHSTSAKVLGIPTMQDRAHLIKYADDFIVTASDKSILSTEVSWKINHQAK